jgi:hypothetical protein
MNNNNINDDLGPKKIILPEETIWFFIRRSKKKIYWKVAKRKKGIWKENDAFQKQKIWFSKKA